MGKYVVLNFEDKIADTQKGAADSTIKGLKARYEIHKQPKGVSKIFLSKNAVTEMRCVEAGQPIKFTDDPQTLSDIRTACGNAEKIYLVMHGDPRTTDLCYTNAVPSTAGVIGLASAQQLADFLAPLLSSAKKEYRLALIMCYGARCKNYLSANVNHQGMIPQQDLVTSFAYRLFHALVSGHGVKARLSAVTGKIAHDSNTGGALVEVEEMIDLNMEFSEANSAKLASMRTAVGVPLGLDKQDDTYKANYKAWETSDEGKALIQREKTVQDAKKTALDSLPTPKKSGSMHKYGKIEYRVAGNTLTIRSKYGDSSSTLAPGTALYTGPMLPPG
jgi:hypothetical protein